MPHANEKLHSREAVEKSGLIFLRRVGQRSAVTTCCAANLGLKHRSRNLFVLNVI